MKRYFLTEALNRIQENIIAFDSNGRITYVNQAFANLLKLETWQMIGKNIWKLQPHLVGTDIYKNAIEALERKEIRRIEWKNVTGKVWETSFFPSENGITAIGRDITEKKKAQEILAQLASDRAVALKDSQDRYHELVEGLPEMVLEVDNRGLVTFANSRVIEATGYTSEELALEFDANRLVAAPDRQRSKENMLKMFTEGKRQSTEYLFIKKDGTTFPVLLISMPILRGSEIVGIRGIIIDITERKILEQQLKENERLAAIGATAGWVGHDIRNPLQAMLSDAYLLKDSFDAIPESPTRTEIAESLERLERNIGYINKIVADLQDYSRPLKPGSKNVNLYGLVTDVFVPFDLPDNICPVINIDCSLEIRTDSSILRRILTNLILNSIQAMPHGGDLTISCLHTNSSLSIVVKDTGVGIPEDVKPKLFTPMMTTKSKGQGFGLPVVKRMTESLGGTVTFESQEGKGTTFTIRLPISPKK